MTVTLKVQQIIHIVQTIENSKFIALPSKASYWLGRYYALFQPVIKNFEELRTKLIREKYGYEDQENKTFQVKPECLQDFVNEIQSLLEQEENFETQTLALEDFGTVNLSPEFFIHLSPLIKH